MFRKLMQRLFNKPVTWLAEKLSSAPKPEDVNRSLSDLLATAEKPKNKRCAVAAFNISTDKFIIFSDQHKGIRDDADDFRRCEKNYLQALQFYFDSGYQFISLGDCEELWENTPAQVMSPVNQNCFDAELKFLKAKRYYRIFGNHDLEWKYPFQQRLYLRPVFGKGLRVYESLLLKTNYNGNPYSIFIAHGHQGDQRSDGNRFSMWVVASIWTPLQRFLEVSINTPATSFELTDKHNIMMYEWSATQQNLIFISGHTHKPVFASLDHVDKLNKQLAQAKQHHNTASIAAIEKELAYRTSEYTGKQQVKTMAKPSYFNSGCCCFTDGDITGIEISEGFMRLIKWHEQNGTPVRMVLEEAPLSYIFEGLR